MPLSGPWLGDFGGRYWVFTEEAVDAVALCDIHRVQLTNFAGIASHESFFWILVGFEPVPSVEG